MKYLAENVMTSSKNGIIARLGNVYGFGMSRSNVLSRLLEQIELQGDLRVTDTVPIRDFIWVEDVVNGILSLALAEFRDFGDRRIYNLGTGIGTSIGELARLVLEIAGQTERHVVSEIQTTRESSVILDFSDISRVCGWAPSTSLRSGINQLLNVGREG
jgi:UDP-glucose 4-epimerase